MQKKKSPEEKNGGNLVIESGKRSAGTRRDTIEEKVKKKKKENETRTKKGTKSKGKNLKRRTRKTRPKPLKKKAQPRASTKKTISYSSHNS